MDVNLDRLERLAALHRAGALSDAEYEAEKAKILAGAPPVPQQPAIGSTVAEAQLSTTWQRRFAFFRAHGSPLSPAGALALQKLPFWTASSIRFNIWAFVFGPIYFCVLGLWKRALAIFTIDVIVSVIIARLFGNGVEITLSFGWAAIYSMTVNYYRFIKVTQGRDEWNPLTDLRGPTAASPAVGPR